MPRDGAYRQPRRIRRPMDARTTATERFIAAFSTAASPAGDGAGAQPSVADAQERRAFPAEFPEGLKPRLRLFLSVDLVGPTPYQQRRQMWRAEIDSFFIHIHSLIQ